MIGNKEVPGWLYDIKEGNISPDWPYKPDNTTTTNVDESVQNDSVFWASNNKRTQRF